MAAITICCDFGAPQNKFWHCFHCFPIYFPWSDGTRCNNLSFLNSLWPTDCSLPVSSVRGILCGLPFPTPGNIPDPWIKPVSLESPALAGYSLSLNHLGSQRSISSVQLSHVRLFVTHGLQLPCSLPCPSLQASLSITNFQSLLKLMSIELVMPSSNLILCRPLLLLSSILLIIRVFSNESALRIRWPKYWSFSFNISLSNEYSGLISFRMDWLDLLAVQGTLKSLLQHHRSKASILRCSAFFMVQLSHPYMTTGKTIALTRWTFVGKAVSLLFNMLSISIYLYLYKGLLLSHKKEWNVAICDNMESIMLSEIRQREMLCMILLICRI